MATQVRAAEAPVFEESHWAESDFSQNYRDAADIFLPFRQQCIGVITSLFGHFIARNSQATVLDLGCGDGVVVQKLLASYQPAKVHLLDGSEEMLAAARKRLGERKNISYTQASFQNLLTSDPLQERFDFIYSSLAIHHLLFEQKKTLYQYIYNHLSDGGCFINYDVVLSPSEQLEEYYLSAWTESIKTHPGIEGRETLLSIPHEYKENTDNIPDTLESQLAALKEVGFQDVDCSFKHGIFAVFGGRK
ncbi:MAG: class I SAM-dependent methyltransferase [Candidatus Electrothrix sp. Rat3]|nr:class I SAM-dependent methyltransferase [Candidatus Electrothrix rattekaaiensis]